MQTSAIEDAAAAAEHLHRTSKHPKQLTGQSDYPAEHSTHSEYSSEHFAELLGGCNAMVNSSGERYERCAKESQAILHDHAIPLEKPNLNGAKMNIIQTITVCQIRLNEWIET